MFVAGGDKAGEAAALNSLATVVSDRDDVTPGREDVRGVAGRQHRDRRSPRHVGRAQQPRHPAQGSAASSTRPATAHERSLALRREIADRNWIAISLSNIGVVLFEQDQLREASDVLQGVARSARELGDKRSQVRALHNLAIVEREAGNLAAARKQIEESLVMRAEIGDKRGQIAARVELGMILLALGELARARAEPGRGDQTLGRNQDGARRGARALPARRNCAGGRATLPRRASSTNTRWRCARQMKETRTIVESEVALANLALEEGRLDDAERLVARRRENPGRRQDADAGGGEVDRCPRPPGSQRRRRRRTAARRRPRPGQADRAHQPAQPVHAGRVAAQYPARPSRKRPACNSMACARNFAAPACCSPSSNAAWCDCGSIAATRPPSKGMRAPGARG